jgi:hypothetical protein
MVVKAYMLLSMEQISKILWKGSFIHSFNRLKTELDASAIITFHAELISCIDETH